MRRRRRRRQRDAEPKTKNPHTDVEKKHVESLQHEEKCVCVYILLLFLKFHTLSEGFLVLRDFLGHMESIQVWEKKGSASGRQT